MTKPQSIYVAVHEQRNGYANMLRMRMTADIECDDGSYCRVSTPWCYERALARRAFMKLLKPHTKKMQARLTAALEKALVGCRLQ